MNLLALLGQYDNALNTPEVHEYFGHPITEFIEYCNNGVYDMAVESLRTICEEINNFLGYEFICDFALESAGCMIYLYNGEEVQIM